MERPKSEALKNMEPLIKTSLKTSENIVSNASSKVPEGKFVEIGKLISLPKQEPVIKKVKPKCKEVENITPFQRHSAGCTKDSLICDKCGKFFKNTTNLKMHQVRHGDVKDFACKICDLRFVSPYLLKMHVRVRHMGETPYACQFCEKKFFTSTTRSYHQRTQHIRDWSYECDLCGNRFNTKTDLNRHKYRHTGQKPFRCEVCNLSFPRRYNLKHHYATQSHKTKATSVLNSQQDLIINNDD